MVVTNGNGQGKEVMGMCCEELCNRRIRYVVIWTILSCGSSVHPNLWVGDIRSICDHDHIPRGILCGFTIVIERI